MDEETNDVLWGAKAIAKFIGKSERATFHLLGTGKLPTAKIGRQHVARRLSFAPLSLAHRRPPKRQVRNDRARPPRLNRRPARHKTAA
jgi:hypothetical protein